MRAAQRHQTGKYQAAHAKACRKKRPGTTSKGHPPGQTAASSIESAPYRPITAMLQAIPLRKRLALAFGLGPSWVATPARERRPALPALFGLEGSRAVTTEAFWCLELSAFWLIGFTLSGLADCIIHAPSVIVPSKAIFRVSAEFSRRFTGFTGR